MVGQSFQVLDCCNTMQHDNFCGKFPTDLSTLQYRRQCKTVSRIFGNGKCLSLSISPIIVVSDKLYKHCCLRKRRTSPPLHLPFKLHLMCRYLKLFNSTNPGEMSKYSEDSFLTIPSDLKSRGLACRTNRTVQFAVMDRRYSGHFARQWNLNISTNFDQFVLISVKDEALHSRPVRDSFKDIDELLSGYANNSIEPTILDETRRGSHFSNVKIDEDADEVSVIEKLTADSFRSQILNNVGLLLGGAITISSQKPGFGLYMLYAKFQTDRTYSAVVFFSGGSWHGQSMAVTQLFHTVYHEFSSFNTLIRFFIIDVSRNSLPWAYVFDSLPSLMFFPAYPFSLSQSARFPNDLVLTVPNLMAFLLARAQPELRFRVALRGCTYICLEKNRKRLLQFEEVVRQDIRSLRLMKRKYAHRFGSRFVTNMLRK